MRISNLQSALSQAVKPHFLDIEIYPNWLGICHKYSQTGQYVNSDSFTIWKGKMSWIHSLVTKAKRICSENYLNKETQLIKNYAACNVCRSTFLISVRNEHCVIKCLIKSQKKVPQIL